MLLKNVFYKTFKKFRGGGCKPPQPLLRIRHRLGCLITFLERLNFFTSRVRVCLVYGILRVCRSYSLNILDWTIWHIWVFDDILVLVRTLWFEFQPSSTPTGSWLLLQSSLWPYSLLVWGTSWRFSPHAGSSKRPLVRPPVLSVYYFTYLLLLQA